MATRLSKGERIALEKAANAVLNCLEKQEDMPSDMRYTDGGNFIIAMSEHEKRWLENAVKKIL